MAVCVCPQVPVWKPDPHWDGIRGLWRQLDEREPSGQDRCTSCRKREAHLSSQACTRERPPEDEGEAAMHPPGPKATGTPPWASNLQSCERETSAMAPVTGPSWPGQGRVSRGLGYRVEQWPPHTPVPEPQNMTLIRNRVLQR